MELSNNIISFLNSYRPKSRVYTSFEEINKIIEILNINEKSLYEIRDIRNAVVIYYSNLKDIENNEGYVTEQYFKINSALMSITGAIDNYIVNNFGINEI